MRLKQSIFDTNCCQLYKLNDRNEESNESVISTHNYHIYHLSSNRNLKMFDKLVD